MSHATVRNLFFGLLIAGLPLSACKKKDPAGSDKPDKKADTYKEIEKTFDESEPPAAERKPVDGINTEALEPDGKKRFESLADTLPSPCGKAHSLRTSRNTDEACKRAPFAASYVFELIKDGANDDEVKELYALRFREVEKKEIAYSPEAPHAGPSDAPVKIAEYFDFGCPACKMMKEPLAAAMLGYETEVALYYKQFPLASHEDSGPAAQAALAAHKQGKYDEMHNLLFEDQHNHKGDALRKYAQQLGLDMTKFEADFTAAKALVEVDKQEGVKLGVQGTPAIYINGIPYEGPSHPKYMKMWIDEALAGAR